jgi:hypothetical protein
LKGNFEFNRIRGFVKNGFSDCYRKEALKIITHKKMKIITTGLPSQ